MAPGDIAKMLIGGETGDVLLSSGDSIMVY